MSDANRLSDASAVTMTADGLVPIPAALRDKAGLAPGAAMTVGLNDRGEVVVMAGDQGGARVDRFQSRLERSLESGIVRDAPPGNPAV